jgi:nicotinamide riboside kinase
VADKCVIDYHIYAKALNMDPDVVEITRKIALKTHQYDHVFFIRPEFPIVDDGLRSTNQAFQDSVHETYENFLKENNISFIYITGSIDSRFEQIRKYLEN